MNSAQKIQLDRIRLAGEWNDFDGQAIADRFENNQHLWEAFVFGRFQYGALIELRDLSEGYINADTIYALVKRENIESFEKMLVGLNIDEIGWCDEGMWVGTPGYRGNELYSAFGSALEGFILFRLWWD